MKDPKKMNARARYEAKTAVPISLRLNRNTDKDILSALEGKAKQTEIKRLIRIGIENDWE